MDTDFETEFCNELNIALEQALCPEFEEDTTTDDVVSQSENAQLEFKEANRTDNTTSHIESLQSEFEEVDTIADIVSHIGNIQSESVAYQTLHQTHTIASVLEASQYKTDHISGNQQSSVEEFELSVAHLHNPRRRVEAVRMCYVKEHRQHIMHLLDKVGLQWMDEMDSTGVFKDGYRIDAQVAHDTIKKYTESNNGKFPEWIGVLKVDGNLSLCSMPNPSGKPRILPESFACLVVNGSVDVSNNQINDLPFHLSDLYIENSLDLSNNELVQFKVSSDLYIPGSLNLSNNKFKCLPDDFSKYAVIVGDLILSYNRDLQTSNELLGLAVQGRVVTEGVFSHNKDIVDTLVILDDIACKNTMSKEIV